MLTLWLSSGPKVGSPCLVMGGEGRSEPLTGIWTLSLGGIWCWWFLLPHFSFLPSFSLPCLICHFDSNTLLDLAFFSLSAAPRDIDIYYFCYLVCTCLGFFLWALLLLFSSPFAVLLNCLCPNPKILPFSSDSPPYPTSGEEWESNRVVLCCWLGLCHDSMLDTVSLFSSLPLEFSTCL